MRILQKWLAGFFFTIVIFSGASVAFADGNPTKPHVPPTTTGNNFSFVRLYVSNLGKSVAFYTQVLGLHEVRRLSPPTVPATEIFFGSDNPNASLIDIEERLSNSVLVSPEPNAGSAVFCVEVKDVAAALKKAASAGGKIAMQGSHVQWPGMAFTWAVADDPDGNHIELINYE